MSATTTAKRRRCSEECRIPAPARGRSRPPPPSLTRRLPAVLLDVVSVSRGGALVFVGRGVDRLRQGRRAEGGGDPVGWRVAVESGALARGAAERADQRLHVFRRHLL